MTSCTPLIGAAVDEFQGLTLGDARLHARVRRFVKALAPNPAAGIPAAVTTSAEREAVYRLLRNPRVTLDGLVAPHVAQTVQRAAARPRPLVVIDKTPFIFGGESDRSGLTRLGAARQGFDAFVALAVRSAREPLGVLAITPLPANAGAAGADAWLQVVETADAHLGAQQPIYVMDREADAYRVFAALHAAGRDFVVRVAPDRLAHAAAAAIQEPLSRVVARTPVRGLRTVRLARRSGVGKAPDTNRRHPPRAGREAQLTLRACAVVLPRPPKLPADGPATVTLNLVEVTEAHAPADVAPVSWWLLTTLPIADAAQIAQVVDHYRARWTIEEYFKVLKSGCAYEKRQLESRATLLNALGILAPLAWRLLALRSVAEDPTLPATAILETDELHVLRQISRDVPLGPQPTAADALRAIARLGGHFPQNGRPGWQVLWIGFHKLLDRVEGYRLARAELRPRRRSPIVADDSDHTGRNSRIWRSDQS